MSHDSQPFSPLPRSEDRPVAALDAPLDAATRRFDMDELTRYREANQQFRSGGVTRRSIERQASAPSASTQQQHSEAPCKPRGGIRADHRLSRSLIDTRSLEAERLRARFLEERQSLAIFEGHEVPAGLVRQHSFERRQRRRVVWLSATVMLAGAAAQLCKSTPNPTSVYTSKSTSQRPSSAVRYR